MFSDRSERDLWVSQKYVPTSGRVPANFDTTISKNSSDWFPQFLECTGLLQNLSPSGELQSLKDGRLKQGRNLREIGGGVFIHIFMLCRRISFKINSNSKEVHRAEHECMN